QSGIGRWAVLSAGFDERVPATMINRYCGSGLEAVNLVAGKVMAGQIDLGIGGGLESMSRTPMGSSGFPAGTDPLLAAEFNFVPQGVSADLIATRQGYTRAQLDGFAVESQRRAKAAWDNGWFARSVVPVRDRNGLVILDRDEHLRPESTVESLGKLEPSFAKVAKLAGFDRVVLQRYPDIERLEHFHHAGNSSGIVDGAAAVLLGNQTAVDRTGIKPRARIRAFAACAEDPCIMLTGPAEACRIALRKARMNPSDVHLWEINEAFASVALYFMEKLHLDHAKVNVNGGAIAMGHPLGATGAIILGTLLDELERRNQAVGVATLCVAGGMAVATVIERV
ncbi:MAG: acetyl-CoA C-acetyltransferase, partial [Gemmatimonadetes bacterium]|nr:acetyl-CoA C-acetyltransferase [Gemmatimonadota bacterium]